MFLELNSKTLHSKKETLNSFLLFTSFIKHEITTFHVVVVQYQQRNVQKQCASHAEFCFPNMVLRRMNIHVHWTWVSCFWVSELMSCQLSCNYNDYWKKFLRTSLNWKFHNITHTNVLTPTTKTGWWLLSDGIRGKEKMDQSEN